MISVLTILLRIAVLFLLILPALVPTVPHERPPVFSRPVHLITSRPAGSLELLQEREAIKQRFGSGAEIRVSSLHSYSSNPILMFEELGQQVKKSESTVVIDIAPTLWGDAATRFRRAMTETRQFQSQQIYRTSLQETKQNFLMLSSVYVPRVSFLGEETIATILVDGQVEPSGERQIELIARSNERLLTSVRHRLTANDKGRIHELIKVPLSFLHAKTQVLNISLQGEDIVSPLNQASTTVFVAHNKTNFLHVAVGPDWSLRTLRHKLKFWPNLDLLSYYILRERWDENLIHTSELSLIEFPADKLFGEQLPNFHGIVAQNFYFDHYLRREDAMNLVNYVRQGGRMYLHPGPLSFLSDDPAIRSLFPCKNTPEFTVLEKSLGWQVTDHMQTQLAQELLSAIPHLRSAVLSRPCELKPEVSVLASTTEGDPVLTAAQLGKGLVITSLASDWHTQATHSDLMIPSAMLERHAESSAREKLFRWIIEFLQRRQDSGLRPPDLLGPRISELDTILIARSRGTEVGEQGVSLKGEGGRRIRGRTKKLDFLGMEIIQLDEPVGEIARSQGFTHLDLALDSGNLSEAELTFRGGAWPVTPSVNAAQAALLNPNLLQEIPELTGGDADTQPRQGLPRSQLEQRPLIEAYPWLVALALALLACDTLLQKLRSHRQPRPPQKPELHSENNKKGRTNE